MTHSDTLSLSLTLTLTQTVSLSFLSVGPAETASPRHGQEGGWEGRGGRGSGSGGGARGDPGSVESYSLELTS